jgi:hypothetical protein
LTASREAELQCVPEILLEGVSDAEVAQIDRWWAALPVEVQSECARLCDPRSEDTAWSGAGATLEWHELPIQLKGRLVDEETRRETRMYKQELFDYIVNHEEVQFFLEERKFHICHNDPVARAILESGFLPASFRCPLERGDCPMRTVLKAARGKSIELTPGIDLEAIAATSE